MDIAFYLTASLGIIIFGISKGGFAGPASILAVPIMSLTMNPVWKNDFSIELAPKN